MTRFKLSICSLGFALIFVPWAIPQDVVISRSTTVKEKLKQYNIGVSKEALVQALHNPNAEIRNLAAQQLAGEGDRDAIPEIIKALDAEKALPIRINIAFALAWLGEKKGGITLKDACNESSVPGYLRARAASYLLDVSEESCLNSALSLAESGSEPTDRMAALNLLPRFKMVSKEDSERRSEIIGKSLTDSAPVVRLTASSALVAIDNQLAVLDLQRAIVVEQDKVVRAQMEADLHRLQSQNTDQK